MKLTKLIADSGATKTEWSLIGKGKNKNIVPAEVILLFVFYP